MRLEMNSNGEFQLTLESLSDASLLESLYVSHLENVIREMKDPTWGADDMDLSEHSELMIERENLWNIVHQLRRAMIEPGLFDEEAT